MSALTNYLETQLGTHLLRAGSFAKPTGIHIALFTAVPGEDGTGGVEVSTTSTGYARVQHGPGDAEWVEDGSVPGKFSNVTAVTFPAPSGDWGQIVGVGLYDAATGGNLLARATMGATRTVASGDTAPKFEAGALVFQLD